MGDKSDPDVIYKMFSMSKGTFKKAIGGLYKQGKIVIEEAQHPPRGLRTRRQGTNKLPSPCIGDCRAKEGSASVVAAP